MASLARSSTHPSLARIGPNTRSTFALPSNGPSPAMAISVPNSDIDGRRNIIQSDTRRALITYILHSAPPHFTMAATARALMAAKPYTAMCSHADYRWVVQQSSEEIGESRG